MVVLGCVEVLYGYLYLSILRLNRLRLITHFDFADVAQKLAVDEHQQSFVEHDAAFVLFFDKTHRNGLGLFGDC